MQKKDMDRVSSRLSLGSLGVGRCFLLLLVLAAAASVEEVAAVTARRFRSFWPVFLACLADCCSDPNRDAKSLIALVWNEEVESRHPLGELGGGGGMAVRAIGNRVAGARERGIANCRTGSHRYLD